MLQWAFSKAGKTTPERSGICHLNGTEAGLGNLGRYADIIRRDLSRDARNTEQYSPTQRFEMGCLSGPSVKLAAGR